ncbi:hypothetical protein H072_11221 [Dactylellina haptotyla CBS 200.50]|uniref:Uncharacterized protein n=1 Tax=Dactylellina haptotyla (strain CBS 200.50) TaxID=1284197 RepID=S8BJH4_DACHA|nr:hypothetical protein H072_11221 [Dactylellina haptotyla CBS 200.50]
MKFKRAVVVKIASLLYLSTSVLAVNDKDVTYEPKKLAENQQLIKNWADESLRNLRNTQAAKGLNVAKPGPSSNWAEPADLAIVPRKRWEEFEHAIKVKSIKNKGPEYYLLEAGRVFVWTSRTLLKLTEAIKIGITIKEIKEDAPIWDLYGAIYGALVSSLYNPYAGDPAALSRARQILNPTEGNISTVYGVNNQELDYLVEAARIYIRHYEDRPGKLNPGGSLYTPFEGPPTVASQKASIKLLFDYNGGTNDEMDDIYINDSVFLEDWRYVIRTIRLLSRYMNYMITVAAVPMWDRFAKEYKTDDNWKLIEPLLGKFDRRKIGYKGYFDKKYSSSLEWSDMTPETWRQWTNKDKKQFPYMLSTLVRLIYGVTRKVLPFMMEMFGDIAVEATDLANSSKFERPESFAIADPRVVTADLALLKQYPEFSGNMYKTYQYN